MKIRDVMTRSPACCTPESTIVEACRMMVDNDCGAIPVVENMQSRTPIGVITDRDVACRVVAAGRNPLDVTVGEFITRPCVTLSQDASLDEACELLERKRIRRLVVVDSSGCCVGMVAQADIARAARDLAGELVEVVSERTSRPSQVELQ